MRKCLVISHPSDLAAADLYEYRFDRFLFKKEHIRYPCIFTIRTQDQGGAFRKSEKEREKFWHQILNFRPTYIDLEYNAPFSLPGKKIISYHNFEKTPPLEILPKVDKIACQAQSINDALRLFTFSKKHNILGIAMGEHGLITRLFATPWTYVSNNPEYGQLTLEELKRFDTTKPLYGLIGGRVTQSPSHITHNQCGVCYIKMAVQPYELEEFFSYAHLFKGLSVTVPLKEKVIPFLTLDQNAREIGAVNTILIRDKLYGFNTDGKGALDVLGEVSGKKMLILGAGGSARAIAYEAKKRGAAVAIYNRTLSKACMLAEKWDLQMAKPNQPYEILVNTTGIVPHLIPRTTILDINFSLPPYLKRAHRLGCHIKFGFEMFVNQAIEQFKIWKP